MFVSIVHTCIQVCDPVFTCVHIYWYRDRQTESDHCWSLIGLPINSLAHLGTMMDMPLCPCTPALAQRPSSQLWPLLSGTDPPLSVQCSQDQHPRQCPFRHSGPQCYLHKLSQALGLNEYTAMGFSLCKHTEACGWQVWSSKQCLSQPPSIPKPAPQLKPHPAKPHPKQSEITVVVEGGCIFILTIISHCAYLHSLLTMKLQRSNYTPEGVVLTRAW